MLKFSYIMVSSFQSLWVSFLWMLFQFPLHNVSSVTLRTYLWRLQVTPCWSHIELCCWLGFTLTLSQSFILSLNESILWTFTSQQRLSSLTDRHPNSTWHGAKRLQTCKMKPRLHFLLLLLLSDCRRRNESVSICSALSHLIGGAVMSSITPVQQMKRWGARFLFYLMTLAAFRAAEIWEHP